MPEDSPEEIAAKRKRFEAARADPRRGNLRIASDLYVAAFLTPKTGGVPANRNAVTIPTTAHVWDALAGRTVYGPLIGRAQDLAGGARAFHWPLEFPDVMAAGGFDAVLGNPPWDKIQPEETKFFAPLRPEIAYAESAKTRKMLIQELPKNDPHVSALWKEYTRNIDAYCQFIKCGSVLTLSSEGNLNNYRLFTEFAAALMSARGMVGLVVQTGLATDETGKELFSSLLAQGRLKRFLDFENRIGFFPDIDTRMRFALLTLRSATSSTAEATAEFGWLLHTIEESKQSERLVSLSPNDLLLFNPSSGTCPVFPSMLDFEISKKIYRSGQHIYIDAEHKLAKMDFWGEMFNMTRDSSIFSDEAREGYLPLYEAKFIHQFDHRFASTSHGDTRELTSVEKNSPNLTITPRSYVDSAEVLARSSKRGVSTRWLSGFRSVASPTNERTAIFAVFPFSAVGNSINLVLGLTAIETALLMANVNSIVFDFCARQKVSGANVNIWIFKQLPAIPFARYEKPLLATHSEIAADWLLKRILPLVYTANDLKAFADDCEYYGPPFPFDDDWRAFLRAELDSWYARAYGLTRDELRYILDPADVKGPDYPSETFRVLKKNEIAKYGEFRTARLVLDAWDRMERGEIPEVSPPVVLTTAAEAPSIVPIDPKTLPDGAWAASGTGQDAMLAQLAALIRALPGAMAIPRVRLAGLFALEPRYLTRRLSSADRAMWRRLVGATADVLDGANIVALAPRIDTAWGAAIAQLRGMGALDENAAARTWAAGPKISEFQIDPKDWTFGRAAFVLKAMEGMTFDDAVADLATEDQVWMRAHAA